MKVLAVVPAHNEEERIARTVAALKARNDGQEVVVIDDGSVDGTSRMASAAGARLIKLEENQGKGGALNKALQNLEADVFLFVDADLEDTATTALDLADMVTTGDADMAIADLPAPPRKGGIGLVRKLASWGIYKLSGFEAAEPLSGQRALRREVLRAAMPLEAGFGVEVGLTIDAVRAGFRVEEVSLPLSHAATGRDLQGFLHRGRQFAAVLRVLLRRSVAGGRRGGAGAFST